jgi:DNA repair protein RadC
MNFKHNRNELSRFHPSGDVTPSQDDLLLTQRLKEAGEILGIQVVDHVILGYATYVSLKERGQL